MTVLRLVLVLGLAGYAFEAAADGVGSNGCIEAQSPDVLTLYVAPNGSEVSDGTCEDPLASLSAAHEWIKQHDPNVTSDYLIYVRGGLYLEQTVEWTAVSSEQTITIEAYPGETPIFDGNGSEMLISLWAHTGSCTNLHIRGLTIKHYVSNAVRFRGSRGDRRLWNGCNVVADNVFIEIGSRYNTNNCPGCRGYAGVGMVNSRYNTVENNVFYRIENRNQDGKYIHALYLANSSSNNLVRGNYVSFCSGDAMKLRDGSNDNEFFDNYIDRSGYRAFFADLPKSGEEISTGNVVGDNVLTFAHPDSPEREVERVNCRGGCSGGQRIDDTGQLLYSGIKPRKEHVGAIAVGDFDGDGEPELIVAFNYADFTKVVSTNGAGDRHLHRVLYLSEDWSVENFAAGDFEGLGRDQLVTHFRSRHDRRSQIFRGTAVDTIWESETSSLLDLGLVYETSDWDISAMAVGSFAGTGDELVTAMRSAAGETRIYRGDGVSNPLGRLLYTSTRWSVLAMTAGDFYGDSRDELVTALRSSRRTRLFIGNGVASAIDGGFFFDSTKWTIGGLATGDFDGSGTLQLVGSYTMLNGKRTRVYRGDHTRAIRFGYFYDSPHWSARDLATGEFMADGTPELVTSFVDDDENQIWVGNAVDSAQDAGVFHRFRSP